MIFHPIDILDPPSYATIDVIDEFDDVAPLLVAPDNWTFKSFVGIIFSFSHFFDCQRELGRCLKMSGGDTSLILVLQRIVPAAKRTWKKVPCTNLIFPVINGIVILPEQLGEWVVVSIDDDQYHEVKKILHANNQFFYHYNLNETTEEENAELSKILPSVVSTMSIFLNGEYIGNCDDLSAKLCEAVFCVASIDVSGEDYGKIIEHNGNYFILKHSEEHNCKVLKQLCCDTREPREMRERRRASESSSGSSSSRRKVSFGGKELGSGDLEMNCAVSFHKAEPIRDAMSSGNRIRMLKAIFSPNSYRSRIGFWLILGKNTCQFCNNAKELLIRNNQQFTYVEKSAASQEQIEWFKARTPAYWNTLPIILLDNIFLGGFSELTKYMDKFKR